MDLKAFRDENGRDGLERLAENVGTSYGYLIQILHGFSKPSPKLARQLVEASGGQLTLEALRPDIYGPISTGSEAA